MNIFLVGNGPTTDLTDQVDSADLVIRLNKVPTYGKTTGTKTDWLVLVNTGEPGAELIRGIKKNPAYVNAAEIVIPLCPELLVQERLRLPSFPYFNDSAPLLKTEKPVRTIPKRTVDELDIKLRKLDSNYTMASTGMMIIEYLLETHDHINICGFGHAGWSGHPWDAERSLTDDYVKAGRITRHGENR